MTALATVCVVLGSNASALLDGLAYPVPKRHAEMAASMENAWKIRTWVTVLPILVVWCAFARPGGAESRAI